jgi:flavin reductase
MTTHTMEARFEGATWHTMLTGAPVLDGSLVAFDCRIDQIIEVGTHDVFICTVDAVEVGEVNEGLIYYARGYHRLAHRG